ncbi:hypothetical protein [Paenibacillus piscarius]|nr:hypothetical protein [Paenibacillus piscarius]
MEKSIQSVNQSIEIDEQMELLFEELSERTEMSCSGNACGGNISGCIVAA